MQKLLVATTSSGKLGEIQEILEDLSVELVMLSQVKLPKDFEVIENKATFSENAALKARAYGKAADLLTLADDSGLCVDALGGKPGLHTARYAQGTDKDRWKKLLKELADLSLTERRAQFVSAVAVYDPKTKKTYLRKGICSGKIAFGPKGKHGFGYDPIFIVNRLGKHFAELTRTEKNQVSHRARSIKKIKPILKKLLDEN